ncbi:hypothetical protein [Streptomyces sp. SHP 1-2]|uniref:hypothetical protein n=1 Tax=Streptomyces sp. SHP 1-2 TaxID=2769489 RepID=UPI002237D8C2|nr:hypothetical protein [Streptomyces sp. SHP 1-2]MCW5249804.1 hypothetical protein [Streptomyces sp. SHP 1-2]
MFSDVGPMELVTLGALAVLLFGPERLAGSLRTVRRFLRAVREMSDRAERDIRAELGPEFQDFRFEDLRRPDTLVRRHLLDDDRLGLDGVREALDPRRELTEIGDTLREAASGEPGPASAAREHAGDGKARTEGTRPGGASRVGTPPGGAPTVGSEPDEGTRTGTPYDPDAT